MKLKLAAALLLSLSSFAAIADNACRSSSICIYSKMPLWNQGNSELRKHINKEKNLHVKQDPGWCGMVSTAMFLRGIANERLVSADMPNEWDALKFSDYDYILQAGELVKTNLAEGGTFTNQAADGIAKVRKKSHLLKVAFLSHHGRFYSDLDGKMSALDIRSSIQKDKPAHYIAVGIYNTKVAFDPKLKCEWKWVGFLPFPDCKTVYTSRIYYERDSGHALVINGYDGKYFKIYDPWGRVYNVSMSEVEVEINGRKRKMLNFVHQNGSKGFAASFPKQKLLLESTVGWSLLRP